jgi:hypothetical protein
MAERLLSACVHLPPACSVALCAGCTTRSRSALIKIASAERLFAVAFFAFDLFAVDATCIFLSGEYSARE